MYRIIELSLTHRALSNPVCCVPDFGSAAITQMPNGTLRAGAVKARSAAERGGGAQRRGLDGAEHSGMMKRVMCRG